MKKFTIAFIVNNFPSVSETFILNQITDMVERGHHVQIYAFKKKKLKVTHQSIERYQLLEKTTYLSLPPGGILKKAGWFLAFILKHISTLAGELGVSFFRPGKLKHAIRKHSIALSLANFLNKTKFEIVHAHFGQRGAMVADLMEKGRVGNFKLVTSFHGYDLNPLYVNRYKTEYENLFKASDAVTVNSPYLQEILLAVCPHPKNLIRLPEGLRTEQYTKGDDIIKKDSNDIVLLFCGRFVEFKAPDLAVRILEILVKDRGHDNVRLRMIGDGKLRAEVEQLIQRGGLQNNILLLGALNQEQVVEEMKRADIFLLPGIHEKETGRAETQGLVIQEAQAIGLPAVVSTAGGMRYGLIDGVSGYVVKEKDVNTFADKVELLISDESLRKRMGEAGREYVVNHFDTRILGEKLVQLYSSI